MLYLPPGVAHEGTALEPCLTYSIGFRAPRRTSSRSAFLAFLEDRLEPGGPRYADPDLRPARRPAALDDAFVERCAAMLGRDPVDARRRRASSSAPICPSPSRTCNSFRRHGRSVGRIRAGGGATRRAPRRRDAGCSSGAGGLPERRERRGGTGECGGVLERLADEREAPARDFGHAGRRRPALHLVSGRVARPGGRGGRRWMTSRRYCRNPSGS